MKKRINIALIGSGAMGRAHAAAVSNLKYCYAGLPFEPHLHTLVTRDSATAREKADALGFENYSLSLEETLNRADIDVVDICTPNICHYDEVKAALAHGKNILCEKPLGITAAQAEELAALAEKSGKVCGVVFNNRHLPAAIRARELVAEGRLGRILSFRSAYLHASSTDPAKPRGWKQDKDICGGGVLFDLGSHAIDLLAFVLGSAPENRIETVMGLSQIAYPERTGADGKPWRTNADEAFYITARLAGGACGTIEASKITVGANDDFTLNLYGTDGALRFDLMNPNYLMFYDARAKGVPHGGERGYTAIECVNRYDLPEAVFPGMRAPIGWFRGHIHSMYAYLSAVYENKPFSPSFADGAYVNRVMEAAYRSADSENSFCGALPHTPSGLLGHLS